MSLLDVNEDVLTSIVYNMKVDHDICTLLSNFKSTNKRSYKLIRNIMRNDPKYKQSIENFVQGTRIPCNTEFAHALPRAEDKEAVLQIFKHTKQNVTTKSIGVSACFQVAYGHDCFVWQQHDSPQQADEVRQIFDFIIDIEFSVRDFFQPPTVPMLPNGLADLSQVPDVFRSVLLLHPKQLEYTTVIDKIQHLIQHDDHENYMRLLRVQGTHTMDDICLAICAIEGWNLNLLHQRPQVTLRHSGHYEGMQPDDFDLDPTLTALGIHQLQVLHDNADDGVLLRLSIEWPQPLA